MEEEGADVAGGGGHGVGSPVSVLRVRPMSNRLQLWLQSIWSTAGTMQGVTRRNDREQEAVLFGAAVRRPREQRGIAQGVVADAAGISLTYLSLLERGENTPTLTVVFRICDALGVSPSELLDDVWRQR